MPWECFSEVSLPKIYPKTFVGTKQKAQVDTAKEESVFGLNVDLIQ